MGCIAMGIGVMYWCAMASRTHAEGSNIVISQALCSPADSKPVLAPQQYSCAFSAQVHGVGHLRLRGLLADVLPAGAAERRQQDARRHCLGAAAVCGTAFPGVTCITSLPVASLTGRLSHTSAS